MARNLCVSYSTRPETVEIFLRLSGAGVVLAPVSAPGVIVTHVANSGVFVLTVQDVFAEFLGASVAVSPATPLSATVNPVASATWNNATRQLTITATNVTTTTAPATFLPAADAVIAEMDISIAWADSRVA